MQSTGQTLTHPVSTQSMHNRVMVQGMFDQPLLSGCGVSHQTITAPGRAEKPPRPRSWSSLGGLRLGASSIAYIDPRQDKGVQRPGAPRQRMKEQRDGS